MIFLKNLKISSKREKCFVFLIGYVIELLFVLVDILAIDGVRSIPILVEHDWSFLVLEMKLDKSDTVDSEDRSSTNDSDYLNTEDEFNH